MGLVQGNIISSLKSWCLLPKHMVTENSTDPLTRPFLTLTIYILSAFLLFLIGLGP